MDRQSIFQSLVYAMAECCWMAALVWLIIQVMRILIPQSPKQTYWLTAGGVTLIFFQLAVFSWGSSYTIHPRIIGSVIGIIYKFYICYFAGDYCIASHFIFDGLGYWYDSLLDCLAAGS